MTPQNVSDRYGKSLLTLTLAAVLLAGTGARHDARAEAAAGAANQTTASGANAADDAHFFVSQHYRDFLNREADPAGLAFWTNQITSCGADAGCAEVRRINVSAAFFLSIEFQQTGYLVHRLYKAAFNRTARLHEFVPDTQSIGRGVVVNVGDWQQQLETNKQTFAARFAARPAFVAQYPQSLTAGQFVDALNANTGNSLSAAARDALAGDLAAGTKTRAQVLRLVAENEAFGRSEFNRGFVLMQYYGYLRRNPDDAPDNGLSGYNFWLNKLNRFGGDFIAAEMVKAFIVSGEYRARFEAPAAVTASITAAGGRVEQPGFATVVFPAGAFGSSTGVTLSSTASPVTQTDFLVTGELFSAGLRYPFEVRVNSGAAAPASDFDVIVKLPAAYLNSLPAGAEVKAFGQVFERGGEETLDGFQLFATTFDAASRTLRVTLPRSVFTNGRNADGTFEAIVVVGGVPTGAAATAVTSSASSPASSSPGEQESTIPQWLTDSSIGYAPLSPRPGADEAEAQAAAAAAICEGTSLGAPLQGALAVSSKFNGTTHFGTDYVAADGTSVLAMTDGKIFKIGFDERPLQTPDPRSGKLVKGWGRYVIIENTDGSKTLYAHLQTGSTAGLRQGQSVTKGAVIAKSNNSGGSSGPHLHVEYAPNGMIFKKPSKVDPDACVGSNVTGSIAVRDNGSLADDAFQVVLDGITLGQTAIGASNSFAVNNLRSGVHQLTVFCTIAPDNVGTYEVTLGQGLTFSGGGTLKSGTLTQGGSITFAITAP